MITARDLIDVYFETLVRDRAWEDYTSRALWTPFAVRALAKAGLREYADAECVSKEHRENTAGRAEYLTLDVCLLNRNTWGGPLFVAEHENLVSRNRVQYAAWKLLAVNAERRVLVAYFGPGTEIRTFADLRELVREVCTDNPGKDILLIGGRCDALPRTGDDLYAAHDHAIVGVHRFTE